MYKNRLREFYLYYVQSRDIESFEALFDAVLLEQLINALPVDVKTFVLSKQPKTADECSEFADLYGQMSRNTGTQGPGQTQGTAQGPNGKAQNESTQRQTSRAFIPGKPNGHGNGQASMHSIGAPKKTVCWGCGGPGHKYQTCPRRIRPSAGVCSNCLCYHQTNVPCNQRATGVYASATLSNTRHQWHSDLRGRYSVPIVVNGYTVNNIRDTGCFGPTIISAKYVSEEDYTGETVSCRGAFDKDRRQIPLAIVKLRAPALNCYHDVNVKVGVWHFPDEVECLLGNSLFQNSQFRDILCENVLIRNSGIREIRLQSGATSGINHSVPASRNGQAIRNALTEGRDADQERRDNQNNAPISITSELTDTDREPVAVSGDTGRPRGQCDNPPLGRKLDSDKHEHMRNLTDADRLTEQTCTSEDAENPTERDIRERPLNSISCKLCSTGGASERQCDGTDKTDPDKNAELTVRDAASSVTLIDKPDANKPSTEGVTDEEALIVGEVLTRAKSRSAARPPGNGIMTTR